MTLGYYASSVSAAPVSSAGKKAGEHRRADLKRNVFSKGSLIDGAARRESGFFVRAPFGIIAGRDDERRQFRRYRSTMSIEVRPHLDDTVSPWLIKEETRGKPLHLA